MYVSIYDLVFRPEECYNEAFYQHNEQDASMQLWDNYKPSTYLAPLLTCRQFYADAHLMALSRTLFVIKNPYICLDIGNHLSARLRIDQIASLRYMAFVADARHFRKLCHWKNYAFGLESLRLTELSIILHRSSYWHYLFDFNVALVALLRNLQGVQRLTFVRNNAMVKGTLHTWYNRLVKLILKSDHKERFIASPPCPETTWWSWEHYSEAETVSLFCKPGKRRDLTVEEYTILVAPLYESMKLSMEYEVEDPDPMSRV